MSQTRPDKLARRPLPRAALVAITLTAAACVTALVFRTPLRSRYWAWRVEHAADQLERGIYLAALCNAGDQGRWGTGVLLAHGEAEVRQYGVLVLHHVRTGWARARLLECVTDADENVRRLAAAGLAIHGDESVIPALKWLYRTGDDASAATACLAFERLGTSAAVVALSELALEPADARRHAALVDALAGISAAECVPALLRLLTDSRVSDLPPRHEELERRALGALQRRGYPLATPSQPTTGHAPQTIAERAAAALARITGVPAAFSSTAPAERRAAAARRWSDWHARRTAGCSNHVPRDDRSVTSKSATSGR